MLNRYTTLTMVGLKGFEPSLSTLSSLCLCRWATDLCDSLSTVRGDIPCECPSQESNLLTEFRRLSTVIPREGRDGDPGETRTHNILGLSQTPLPIGLRGRDYVNTVPLPVLLCPSQESNPVPSIKSRDLLPISYKGMAPVVGIEPTCEDPKSSVLPLNETGMVDARRIELRSTYLSGKPPHQMSRHRRWRS